MVHNILKQVAVKMDCTLLSLYEQFGWDLYDQYDHAFDAFRLVMSEPDQVFKDIEITEDQKRVLIEAISKKMAPSAVKIRTDFELTCFTYEGIDALKEALLTAKSEVNEEHFQVQVILQYILKPIVVQIDCPTSLSLRDNYFGQSQRYSKARRCTQNR